MVGSLVSYHSVKVHLDLTANCLMHHDALAPVSGLSRLKDLRLSENPLASHPQHREFASSWLHPDLASRPPSLDGRGLSRSEVLQVGSSRLVVTPSISPSRPTLEDDLQSVSCEGSLVSVSTVSRRRRRRRRVREAIISDESEFTSATTETEDKQERTGDKTEVSETLHGLRERYGDNWLRSGASEKLQEMLGIEQTREDTDTDTLIQQMMDREQAESNLKSRDENNEHVTEPVKSVSRRSSDEVPDAIDRADDLFEENQKVEEIDSEVRAEAKISVGSDNFYSSHSERESSPSDKSCRVKL